MHLRIAVPAAALCLVACLASGVQAQYKPGDKVVVFQDAELQVDQKAVGKVASGKVLTVEKTEGKLLWVRADAPGWLDSANVMPGELQGEWVVESALREGKPEEDPVGDTVVFAGTKMTIKFTEERPDQNVRVRTYASKPPRQIDLIESRGGEDRVVQGVYELKDGTLRLCIARPGKPRPTELTSKAEPAQMSLVLKAAGEKKPPKE